MKSPLEEGKNSPIEPERIQGFSTEYKNVGLLELIVCTGCVVDLVFENGINSMSAKWKMVTPRVNMMAWKPRYSMTIGYRDEIVARHP